MLNKIISYILFVGATLCLTTDSIGADKDNFLNYYNHINLAEYYLFYKHDYKKSIRVFHYAFNEVDEPISYDYTKIAKAYLLSGQVDSCLFFLEKSYKDWRALTSFYLLYHDTLTTDIIKKDPYLDSVIEVFIEKGINHSKEYFNSERKSYDDTIMKFVVDSIRVRQPLRKQFLYEQDHPFWKEDSLYYEWVFERFIKNVDYQKANMFWSDKWIYYTIHLPSQEQQVRMLGYIRKLYLKGMVKPDVYFLPLDRFINKSAGVCGLGTTYTEKICDAEDNWDEISQNRMKEGLSIFFKLPYQNYRNKRVPVSYIKSIERNIEKYYTDIGLL